MGGESNTPQVAISSNSLDYNVGFNMNQGAVKLNSTLSVTGETYLNTTVRLGSNLSVAGDVKFGANTLTFGEQLELVKLNSTSGNNGQVDDASKFKTIAKFGNVVAQSQ